MSKMHSRSEGDGAFASAMQHLAAADFANAPKPPDPRFIWLKAEFVVRQKRQRMISMIAGISYSALGATLAFAIYWAFKSGRSISDDVMPSGTTLLISDISPMPLLVMIAVVLVMMLLFAPGGRRSARSS